MASGGDWLQGAERRVVARKCSIRRFDILYIENFYSKPRCNSARPAATRPWLKSLQPQHVAAAKAP